MEGVILRWEHACRRTQAVAAAVRRGLLPESALAAAIKQTIDCLPFPGILPPKAERRAILQAFRLVHRLPHSLYTRVLENETRILAEFNSRRR